MKHKLYDTFLYRPEYPTAHRLAKQGLELLIDHLCAGGTSDREEGTLGWIYSWDDGNGPVESPAVRVPLTYGEAVRLPRTLKVQYTGKETRSLLHGNVPLCPMQWVSAVFIPENGCCRGCFLLRDWSSGDIFGFVSLYEAAEMFPELSGEVPGEVPGETIDTMKW